MNGKNMNQKTPPSNRSLNVRYRRNEYNRKRLKVIITICACSAVILVIALILIGNILKNRSENDVFYSSAQDSSPSASNTVHGAPPSIKGYALDIKGLSPSALSDRISEIKDLGGNAVSFRIRSSEGAELYSSEVAQEFGRQSKDNSLISPEDIALSDRSDIHTSACIDVSAFSEENSAKRSLMLAYDASIAAELLQSGFDDVIFIVPEVTAENLAELLRLAEDVKSIYSEANVGISLPRSAYEAENSAELVASLWEKFDLLAYDMTGYTEGDPAEFAIDNSSVAHYYLLRYNVRVLLPSVETDTLSEMLSALEEKGVTNWQTLN